MIKLTVNLVAMLGLLVTSNSFAHLPIYTHGDVHTHNEAELTTLFSDSIIRLSFIAPSVNVVGFENFPQSSKEKGIIRKTFRKLQKTPIFSAPNCNLQDTEIESILLDSHLHDAEGSKDINALLGGKSKTTKAFKHTDFKISYIYVCTKPTSSISFSGFSHFKNLKKINVRNETDKKIIQTLDRNNTTLVLKP